MASTSQPHFCCLVSTNIELLTRQPDRSKTRRYKRMSFAEMELKIAIRTRHATQSILLRAQKEHFTVFLEVMAENGNTFEQNLLFAPSIDTIDPENIKAILSTQFEGLYQPLP